MNNSENISDSAIINKDNKKEITDSFISIICDQILQEIDESKRLADEKKKELYEKVKFPLITLGLEESLDDIVSYLQIVKNDTTNFYYDFYGHMLYSDTVTLEGAYQEVYKMSREEYRKQLKKEYELITKKQREFLEEERRKFEEKRKLVDQKAREVIPNELMYVFNEIKSLLDSGLSSTNIEGVEAYLEILKELNKPNYSLDRAKKLFERINTGHTTGNYDLIKSIRRLSIHGSAFFNEFYDKKREKEVLEIKRKFLQRSIPNFAIPFNYQYQEPTEEEKLDRFDRKMTTLCLLGYHFDRGNDKED